MSKPRRNIRKRFNMPNLANIISVTRRKIYLVLKGIKVIRIYIAKLVESFFFLFISFVLPLCLWLYLALKTSASRE
jgi:hypothetical protein